MHVTTRAQGIIPGAAGKPGGRFRVVSGREATRRITKASNMKDESSGIHERVLVSILNGHPLTLRCDVIAAVEAVKYLLLFCLLLLLGRGYDL